MIGRRSGLVIDLAAVTKDDEGFDDIDAFWAAASGARYHGGPGDDDGDGAPGSRSSRGPSFDGPSSASRFDAEGLGEFAGGGSPASSLGGGVPAFGDYSDDGLGFDGEDQDMGAAREARDPPPRRRTIRDDDDDDDDDDASPAAGARSRVRAYEPPPADPDADPNVRRSKRAKFPPMKFWKNERLVYARDGAVPAPRVVAVQLGAPTPKPVKRKPRRRVEGLGGALFPPDAPLAPSDYEGDREGCEASLWDEASRARVAGRPVARHDALYMTTLPATGGGPRRPDARRASAAQAFRVDERSCDDADFPAWSSGCMELPPRGIKDAESVGLATMLFFCCVGQAHAVELALNAPDEDDAAGAFDADRAARLLLSPGDSFHVPPNNIYRLENRSTTTPAKLFFAMIKPILADDDDAGAAGSLSD